MIEIDVSKTQIVTISRRKNQRKEKEAEEIERKLASKCGKGTTD